MKQFIAIPRSSFDKFNESNVFSKILTSNNNLVTMKVEMIPKGYSKFGNLVNVYFHLLSNRKHCYAYTIQLLTFTPCGNDRGTIFVDEFFKSTKQIPLREFFHSKCTLKDQFNADYFNLSVEIFCMSLRENMAKSLNIPSMVNSVTMMYN